MQDLLRRPLPLALSLVLAAGMLAGCRSPLVQATVINTGPTELHNIEVDYPSASFGISSLTPGAVYTYRFQLQDAGRMKVQYADSEQKPHSGTGPYAAEGQQGRLVLMLDGNGKIVWNADLRPAVTTPKGE
jgi:hypothetical protein